MGSIPGTERLTCAATHVAPYAETEGDTMMNCTITNTAKTVRPRFGSGGAAAWEECARRSEVFQH